MALPTILHFSTGRYFRGGERQVEFLHTGLRRAGMQSLLACRTGGGLADRNLEGTIPLAWRGEWDTLGLWSLIRICKHVRPAIVHSHDGHSLAHAAIAGALAGAAVVHSRRVFFPLGTGPFSRWKYTRCGAVIGVSEAVAADCRKILPPPRVRVVHDGVDWSAPGLPRDEARRDLRIPSDAFAIGAVAYFTKEKNLALLASFARKLGDRFPQARVVCIGPVRAGGGALPPNLICAGFRPNAWRYYAAFDAFVSASSREGLGSALLDAVVRDIPCIAVDGGGTRDLFPEKTALVAPGNAEGLAAAASRLFDDYKTAAAAAAVFGARARQLFSIENMIRQTIDVYKTIVRL